MISKINSTTAFKGGWQKTAQRAGHDSATKWQELRNTARTTTSLAAQRASILGTAQDTLQQTRKAAPQK